MPSLSAVPHGKGGGEGFRCGLFGLDHNIQELFSTTANFAIFRCTREVIFVSASKFWQPYSVGNCLINLNGIVDGPKPTALNGRWEKNWPEAVSDFR
jgi:hypothetical protein